MFLAFCDLHWFNWYYEKWQVDFPSIEVYIMEDIILQLGTNDLLPHILCPKGYYSKN